MCDVTIRRFRIEDLPEVTELVIRIQANEFGLRMTAAAQPDLVDPLAIFGPGAGNFWVAELFGKIVGCIGLQDLGNGQAMLRKMFVAAEWRGKQNGVAARLMSKLLQWGERRGVSEIYLGTFEAFAAARRFYEKSGFEPCSEAALPKSFERHPLEEHFYRREIVVATA